MKEQKPAADCRLKTAGYCCARKRARQENATINANTTLTGFSESDHNLTVYATDKAGNAGASETIYLNVFPTTLVIASVVTVTVIGIVLLVYFKKRKH